MQISCGIRGKRKTLRLLDTSNAADGTRVHAHRICSYSPISGMVGDRLMPASEVETCCLPVASPGVHIHIQLVTDEVLPCRVCRNLRDGAYTWSSVRHYERVDGSVGSRGITRWDSRISLTTSLYGGLAQERVRNCGGKDVMYNQVIGCVVYVKD